VKPKQFKEFRVKGIDEEGTFEGYLSVFGVVDSGKDVVEKGAFTKTIKEAEGGFVPMLWQHDEKEPIGKLFLEEDDHGLKVRGVLTLEVARAREAYALLKDGVVRGLSIGYKAIRQPVENGIRRLKEIQLFEGSVVTFPMLKVAQVDVDSVKADEQAPEQAVEASVAITEEEKAGRKISAATRKQIEDAIKNAHDTITHLQALLSVEDITSSTDDAEKSIEQAPLEQDSKTPEVVEILEEKTDDAIHLLLKQFKFQGAK
jgi:HK97 family phage prohead protease